MKEIPDNITEIRTTPSNGTGSTPDSDATISPAQDLYRSVNGHWLATHEIPADRAVDGTFHQLRDQAELDVRVIIETASTEEPHGRIGALYSSFMDEEAIDNAGLAALDADLTPIREASTLTELARALGALDRAGISGVIGYYIAKDAGEDIQRPYLVQSGLGLPDEAYYREEQHADTRTAYREFIEDLLTLAGLGESDAAERILAFETELAAGHWDNVTSRDADKTYNPTAIADLPTGFPFAEWLAATGLETSGDDATTIIVNQPSYLEHVAALAENTDLDTWKLWATWHVLTARASLLPTAIAERNWRFYAHTLSGATEQRARWKRGVSLVEGQLGEEVGREFVAKHFPPGYKERMLELVEYLTDAYRERIEQLDWMTPATRERALAKLEKFTAKIGYPDKWRDYSGLELMPGDLLGNVRRASEFNHDYEIGKVGKPTDPETWFATPQTVNAFYNPVNNDITFPAAILRPPFFDPEADAASNFGAIGAVIGHEIGHGFDDQGSKYDGDGNLNSWWTDDDRAAFTKLTDKLVAQFDGLVPTGLAQRGDTSYKVNGQFTLGENIGDLGGLGIAVVALRRYLTDKGEDVASAAKLQVDGLVDSNGEPDTGEYTALQRVFLRWARVWQTAIRPQMSAQYVAIDPHSPAEFRCNVTAANIAEFYEAFDVHEGDAMWLAPEDRVQIW